MKERDPDQDLVAAATGGDEAAFEELVHRHQDRVYTRIYFMVMDRELAADLSQEAFLKAFLGLRGFRGEALFSTWLGRIATNVTLHHIEKAGAQKRKARVVSIHASRDRDRSAGDLEISDCTHMPEEWALRNERQAAILRAVSELEPEFRTALAMRELYGCSYKEIMEQLDLPMGTVKSKIFRARQILQEKLKEIL